MTLYEMADNWLAVLAMLEDGADPEAVSDTLEAISGDIEQKADGYAKITRQLEANAEVCKAEAERLKNKEQTNRNAAKDMKRRLEEAMVKTGKTKFKTDLFSFGIQKNAPSLDIEDETRVLDWAAANAPELLKKTVTIDKAALKEKLKGGEEIPHVRLWQSESLRIR